MTIYEGIRCINCANQDFFDWDLVFANGNEPERSDRYFKHSFMNKEDGFNDGDHDIGEWSTESDKPDGSGICIDNSGSIHISCYNNGQWTENGKYIIIHQTGTFEMGEYTIDEDR